MKMRMITGLQSTGLGEFHLGNYCGVIYPIIKAIENNIIKKEDIFIFIADLHSMTVYSTDLKKKSFNMIKSLMCFNLTENLYIQSQIPIVCEGMWLLSQFTTTGEMNRMTQFKDKKEIVGSNIGLYTYPILMAADVLLMGATHVPVGEDQTQHMEIIKHIAISINKKAKKKIFEIPKIYTIGKPVRIMSLNDVTKKMSKSNPEGCIFFNDSEEILKKKIRTAQTDSFPFPFSVNELKDRKAAENLCNIYSILGDRTIESIIEEFKGVQWSNFKNSLIILLIDFTNKYKNKFNEIENEEIEILLKKNTESIYNYMKKYLEDLYKIFM